MKILMMVSWYTPMGSDQLEAGIFHNEQSVNLKQYCDMALYFPYDNHLEEDYSQNEEWNLMTYRSKYISRKPLKNRKRMDAAMKKIIADFHPDMIHAHCGASAGYYAVQLGKKYHLPVIITEHSPIEISRVDRKFGLSHYFAKKAYSRSKANICVSKDSQEKLSRIFNKCHFEVIYNGIILPEFKNHSHHYYKDGYINIVIVAVLYDLEIKGLKYLLQAMQILKNSGKPFYLHHIGSGNYLEHFENLAFELNVHDIVEFHGQCDRSRLYEIVREMDFFCSSSLIECSGVSVQEAMLLGKPILGTNSGGVDSLVPEKAGHIVQKGNAQALADGAVFMQQHLKDFDQEWIRNYAYHSFEINNISKKYYELYNRVLEVEKNAGH